MSACASIFIMGSKYEQLILLSIKTAIYSEMILDLTTQEKYIDEYLEFTVYST